jgi:hypothetical protein
LKRGENGVAFLLREVSHGHEAPLSLGGLQLIQFCGHDRSWVAYDERDIQQTCVPLETASSRQVARFVVQSFQGLISCSSGFDRSPASYRERLQATASAAIGVLALAIAATNSELAGLRNHATVF